MNSNCIYAFEAVPVPRPLAPTRRGLTISLRIMATVATLVLLVHLAWILLVIFGALFTRGRPFWTVAHVLSLVWGILVEAGPWPCPLTLLEEHFEMQAGVVAGPSVYLLHLLDRLVYPNLPGWVITLAGVTVCAFNLAIYGWRFWNYRRLLRAAS